MLGARLPNRRVAVSLGVLSLAFAVVAPLRRAAAQEMIPDVECISGHTGMNDKHKGVLLIGESAVTFAEKDGTPIFTVPLDSVTDVGSQSDVRDASVGKKILLGNFAGTRKQEFVQITYEGPSVAEGLVFKVKDGTGPGVVAKVKFAAKRRKGSVPASGQ